MNESKISVRYAKALIESAREDNILEPLKEDMDFIRQCIKQIPEFKLIIESPVIRTSEKKSIVLDAFGKQIHPATLAFINLVFTNKREHYLDSISRYFFQLYNQEKRIKPAVLITPGKLDTKTTEKIVAVFSRKLKFNIDLQKQVDEKLIGGFLLRIEDQQIDASVSSGLARIRKTLTHY